MYKYKIKNIEVGYSQADSSNFIDVEVEIYKGEGDKAVKSDTRKFGFPLGTTKETILAEMEKLCVTLASDEEVAKKSAVLKKQLTDVEKLKEEILNPK